MNKYTVHLLVDGEDVAEHVIAWNEYGAEHKAMEKFSNQGRQVFLVWVEGGWK